VSFLAPLPSVVTPPPCMSQCTGLLVWREHPEGVFAWCVITPAIFHDSKERHMRKCHIPFGRPRHVDRESS